MIGYFGSIDEQRYLLPNFFRVACNWPDVLIIVSDEMIRASCGSVKRGYEGFGSL